MDSAELHGYTIGYLGPLQSLKQLSSLMITRKKDWKFSSKLYSFGKTAVSSAKSSSWKGEAEFGGQSHNWLQMSSRLGWNTAYLVWGRGEEWFVSRKQRGNALGMKTCLSIRTFIQHVQGPRYKPIAVVVCREGGREMFSSFLYLSAKASPLRNCGNARPSTQLVSEEQALSTLECQLVHHWPFRILPLSALNPQSGQTLVSAECTGKKCGEGFPVCPAAPPHSPCCTPAQSWFPAHLIWGQLVHHDISAALWAKC